MLAPLLAYYYFFRENSQPLIIIYQNESQKRRMDMYGCSVVFMDATYKGEFSGRSAFHRVSRALPICDLIVLVK